MVKDTCLIAFKRKDQSPRILHLEIHIDLLLKVFVRVTPTFYKNKILCK
jgi:hypothetical protein